MRALDIGCGPKSRWIPDTDGLDVLDFGQKYVGSLFDVVIDATYNLIYLHHLIEHIPDTVALFERVGDLLNPEGMVDIRVPTLPYEHAFQDPTHVKFIPGVSFFTYFTNASPAGHPYGRQLFRIVREERDRFPWELHVLMQKL